MGWPLHEFILYLLLHFRSISVVNCLTHLHIASHRRRCCEHFPFFFTQSPHVVKIVVVDKNRNVIVTEEKDPLPSGWPAAVRRFNHNNIDAPVIKPLHKLLLLNLRQNLLFWRFDKQTNKKSISVKEEFQNVLINTCDVIKLPRRKLFYEPWMENSWVFVVLRFFSNFLSPSYGEQKYSSTKYLKSKKKWISMRLQGAFAPDPCL